MAEAMEKVMSKEHRDILRKNHKILEPDLQTTQLLPYLTDILRQEDEEEIKAERTLTEQARTLLAIVPRKGPTAFVCFVNSLWKVQPHLARVLSKAANLPEPAEYDATDRRTCSIMPPEIRDRLRSSTVREMLKNIDLKPVLNLMKAVLTKTDNELIESKATADEVIGELLAILPKKELKCFDHFLEVLETCKHVDISRFLKGNNSPEDLSSRRQVDQRQVDQRKPLTVHPVYQTPVSHIQGHLQEFYTVTNENNGWQRLAQEFQLPQQNYHGQPNPTGAVITDWTNREGDMADVSILRQTLQRLGLNDSKACLEKVLMSNGDATDAPGTKMNAIIERTQNLSIVPAKEQTLVSVPSKLQDLNKLIVTSLRETMISEINRQSNPDRISIGDQDNYPIREITKQLRTKKLTETIKWMKINLPAGVTGPLLDEKEQVRNIPYRVRSKLTIALTVGGHWKPLAERLKIEKPTIDYFDQRFDNPADKVLTHWETKRNSTVGDLYDLLVELDMPVIADEL